MIIPLFPHRHTAVHAGAPNEGTVFARFNAVRSVREIFECHYSSIRSMVERHGELGVAVLAVDDAHDVGTALWVPAEPETPRTVIIGRHTECDLHLDGDPSVSLRHLLLTIRPKSAYELSLHLIDLRSASGFTDEHERRLGALVADGPVFVRCGRYTLFLLVTGEGVAWPERSRDGWECIPERIYFQERFAAAGMAPKHRPLELRSSSGAGGTVVQGLRGPVHATARLLAESEMPIATLQITCGNATRELVLGEDALKRGVLLGRYERCDDVGLALLDDDQLSRVHLLVVSLAGRTYAIDTASTNGTRNGTGGPARVIPLEHGTSLTLGDDLATLTWRTHVS